MVSFSHHDDGAPESVWGSAAWAEMLSPLSCEGLERLVVVAAHPDDETFGAGGLIARASRLGVRISVVVLSNGEASHPLSTTHDRAQLAALRRVEVTAALARLAPGASLRLLNLPDGALADHREEIAALLTADLGDGGRGTWLVAPWRSDGHPDHAAAGEAALSAARTGGARLLEYPIWAWSWAKPEDPVWPAHALRSLAVEPADQAAKASAMSLHRSQVQALSALPGDEAIIRPGFIAHFTRAQETFIETKAIETRAESTVDGADSLPRPFFNDFYAGVTDPWGFETRWYEWRKRALTLGALPRERFGAALELGCSIGVLTAELARRCDTVLGVDIAERPLELARARLASAPGVTFERRTLPADWPPGTFDLIVLSEVGYYFSAPDLRQLIERCRSSLAPAGALVACHWRHPVPNYPLSGDRVHEEIGRLPGFERTVQHRERDFVLEVFEPTPATSVAEREGLTP